MGATTAAVSNHSCGRVCSEDAGKTGCLRVIAFVEVPISWFGYTTEMGLGWGLFTFCPENNGLEHAYTLLGRRCQNPGQPVTCSTSLMACLKVIRQGSEDPF